MTSPEPKFARTSGPSSAQDPAVLRLESVDLGYESKAVLRELNFECALGERVAVLGPNGGGKSTLFAGILGSAQKLSGQLWLGDTVGIVAQTDRTRLDFPVSAQEVVLTGTLAGRSWFRRPSKAEKQASSEALERVGLAEFSDRTFGELSGGQRQRVLIARTLVRDPQILLLDEPYTGLDAASSQQLDTLIDGLASAGKLLLIATHDVSQARSWDKVLCLNGVQTGYGKPEETLTDATLQRTYGSHLLHLEGTGAVLIDQHHCGDDHSHG